MNESLNEEEDLTNDLEYTSEEIVKIYDLKDLSELEKNKLKTLDLKAKIKSIYDNVKMCHGFVGEDCYDSNDELSRNPIYYDKPNKWFHIAIIYIDIIGFIINMFFWFDFKFTYADVFLPGFFLAISCFGLLSKIISKEAEFYYFNNNENKYYFFFKGKYIIFILDDNKPIFYDKKKKKKASNQRIRYLKSNLGLKLIDKYKELLEEAHDKSLNIICTLKTAGYDADDIFFSYDENHLPVLFQQTSNQYFRFDYVNDDKLRLQLPNQFIKVLFSNGIVLPQMKNIYIKK